MTPQQEHKLIEMAVAECAAAGDWTIQFRLSTQAAVIICGLLQLAMRHPDARIQEGPTRNHGRNLVDKIRDGLHARGLHATARLIELGDNPGES